MVQLGRGWYHESYVSSWANELVGVQGLERPQEVYCWLEPAEGRKILDEIL